MSLCIEKRYNILISAVKRTVSHRSTNNAVSVGGTPAISFRWQGGGGGRTWRSFACLVEVGQSLVLHELVVQLLELVERVLVVLTCALGKDVHPEVGLGNFLFVLLLVGRGQRVSLSLQFLLKHTKSQK